MGTRRRRLRSYEMRSVSWRPSILRPGLRSSDLSPSAVLQGSCEKLSSATSVANLTSALAGGIAASEDEKNALTIPTGPAG